MSTTIATTLNDAIIADKAIEKTKAMVASLTWLTTDLSDETAKKGEKIIVPLPSAITAKTSENDYEDDDATLASAEITLNKYARVTIALSDEQFMNSSVAGLDKFGTQAGRALVKKVIADVMTLLTAANYAKVPVMTGVKDVAEMLVEAGLEFDKNEIDKEQRFFLPSNASFRDMASGTALQIASAAVYGGNELVRDGVIPRFMGFDVKQSNAMPAGAAAASGFVIHPSAIAMAMRPLVPVSKGSYLDYRIIKDAETGVAMNYRRHYSTKTGKMYLTFECRYGFAVAIADAAMLLPAITTGS